MLDRSIRDLGSDEQVQYCYSTKEPGQAPKCRSSIESHFCNSFPDFSFGQIEPDRNQYQSGEENHRKDEKHNNSDIGVINVAADLLG